jgi:VanZ family protein
MEAIESGPSRWDRKILPWAVWLIALTVWTIALVSPDPVRKRIVPEEAAFSLAKLLHVSAYAFLTVLLAWLPVSTRMRYRMAIGLVGHGALTEFLQTFVEGRTGSIRDVLFDALGVGIGLLLMRALARRRQGR